MKSRPAKTIKEALIATKWILENIGWCKVSYWQDKNGKTILTSQMSCEKGHVAKCCLSGAMRLVNASGRDGLWETSLHVQTESFLFDTLKKIRPGSKHMYWSLPGFNDHGLTKFKDVIALLDAAIKECK